MHRSGERVIWLHVGLPKTGTTSIQRMLDRNAAILREAGFALPRAGRGADPFAHHNIPAELSGAPTFVRARGTLADLAAEIAASPIPNTIVSSENFAMLSRSAEKLSALGGALESTGGTLRIVLYIRRHEAFVESLFFELARMGIAPLFETFVERVIQGGDFETPFGPLSLRFPEIAAAFASAFGRDAVFVRGVREGANGDALLDDFLTTVGVPKNTIARMTFDTSYLNTRFTTGDVIRRLAQADRAYDPRLPSECDALVIRGGAVGDAAFAPLSDVQRDAIRNRFAGDVLELERSWGVDPSIFEDAAHASDDAVASARDLFTAGEELRRMAMARVR